MQILYFGWSPDSANKPSSDAVQRDVTLYGQGRKSAVVYLSETRAAKKEPQLRGSMSLHLWKPAEYIGLRHQLSNRLR